ncbi:MAG: mannosyltransferase [Daejeonella sp.]|nr:mannosyltransferase [Daejeonella sp.]
MQLVLFTHPDFGMHQSMPRYSDMLVKGMEVRGHDVVVWKPKARVFLLPAPQSFKKWLGYIDQYLIFPLEIRFRLKSCTDKTVFVFTDHALGPWVPLLKNRPHVIHCHDFLAQKSALGEINENPVSWTGKQYQKYIRRGYSTGKNFISVSNQTRKQLHEMLHFEPECSQVVYNSVNPIFQPMEVLNARKLFGKQVGINIENGFILHVGGNQLDKNRAGVIEI